jgi:hypothetical protein
MYLATVGWVISIPSFKQLAVNARRTPARVVAAHHPDQIADRLRYAGLTGLAAANSPRPEQVEAFTMACNRCFGLDDHQGGFPPAPQAEQPEPEDSISGRQFQPFWSRTPLDGELLPQGEVFQSQLARGFQH